MESIDKLRKAAESTNGYTDMSIALGFAWTNLNEMMLRIAEMVESEIAERYMELPLDAEGVPIRINDEMAYPDGTRFDVAGIGDGGTLFFVENKHLSKAYWTSAKDKRHVNPDTWESIIQEVYELGLEDGEECSTGRSDFSYFIERCEKLAGVD